MAHPTNVRVANPQTPSTMSMLPKLQKTIVTSDGYTKHISTMGDTTHVMVNHFCYHIRQMQEGELRDECVALLKTAKEVAQADTQFGISVDTTNL